MNWVLSRSQRRPDGIFSLLSDIYGQQLAVTIEHAYQQADESFEPKIPNGLWLCRRKFSPRFKCDVFEILVPDHTDIEMHPGNYNKDSEGCICPGSEIAEVGSEELVTHSKDTFAKLMGLQSEIKEFYLTVQG